MVGDKKSHGKESSALILITIQEMEEGKGESKNISTIVGSKKHLLLDSTKLWESKKKKEGNWG